LGVVSAVGAPCGGDRRGEGGRAGLPGRCGSEEGSAVGRSRAAGAAQGRLAFWAQVSGASWEPFR
jgi:hypothetical protein